MNRTAKILLSIVLASAAGPAVPLAAIELQVQGDAESQPPVAPVDYDDLGEPTTVEQARAGTLLLKTERPGWFLPAPRMETKVEIQVRGMIARTTVRQQFSNPTEFWVEGVYVFPLPELAAVDRLRMVIGERVIEGQIKERKEAKRQYEQAKEEGRRASLVEQERANVFTNSVANIGPGESIEVVIGYQQELDYEDGLFQLRFPMTMTPRYIPGSPHPTSNPGEGMVNLEAGVDASEGQAQFQVETTIDEFTGSGWALNTDQVPDASRITPPIARAAAAEEGLGTVRLSVDLDVGFELERVASASHLVRIGQAGNRYRVDLSGQAPADRDFVLEWSPRLGQVPQAALFTEDAGSDEHYAYLLVVPPAQQASQRLNREVIFVLDTSGSMSGASIRQAKAALMMALDQLGPNDLFNVIEFDDSTRVLFAHPQRAFSVNVDDAKRWVGSLAADGGTEMLPALRASLVDTDNSRFVRQVVFITDGAIGNEDHLFAEIHRGLGRSRLFTVGIGAAPNSHFMRRAAQFGRGAFTHIGLPQEVERKMGRLLQKLENPVLSDLAVEWGDRQVEMWPAHAPDLYAGQPLVLVAKVNRLGGKVRIHGERGGRPWTTEVNLVGGSAQLGIGKAWARRKIAALMDRIVVTDSDEAMRQRVTALGLGHQLVTRYTSLVAVDVTPARPRDEPIATKLLPLQMPSGWTPEIVGLLPRTATSSRAHVVIGLFLLGLSMLSYRLSFVSSTWAIGASRR